MPERSAVTAYLRIAPTAIRNRLAPMVMSSSYPRCLGRTPSAVVDDGELELLALDVRVKHLPVQRGHGGGVDEDPGPVGVHHLVLVPGLWRQVQRQGWPVTVVGGRARGDPQPAGARIHQGADQLGGVVGDGDHAWRFPGGRTGQTVSATVTGVPSALDLDAWLPDPQVRTRHRRQAKAASERLWQAAETVRICDAPTLGRVVRWRIPGTPRDLPFRELFRRYPFAVLAEGEHWSVSGLCGRVWTLRRDYPKIRGGDDFLGWEESDSVRVLFAHWVVADGDGRSVLYSESRVQPVGRRARLRLRARWTAIGSFERLSGGQTLRVAARR